jgi:hypothetical protein
MTDLIQIQPSEAAALFNLGKSCRLKLWRKKRRQKPDEVMDYRIAELNEIMRGFFVAKYEDLTGRIRRFGNGDDLFVFRHEAEALDHGPLIVKTTSKESFLRVKRNGLSEDQIVELQAAMLATDATWGSYAVGSRDSGELLHFDIDRADAVCQSIQDALPSFQAQVENGPAPDMLEPDDHRCQVCEYRVSCQGAALLALEESTENDESLAPLIAEYQKRQQKVKDAEDLLLESRDALERAMRDRTTVMCGKKRVTWKVQERADWDGKKLADRYADMWIEMLNVAKSEGWEPSMLVQFPPAETMKKVSISRPLRIWG